MSNARPFDESKREEARGGAEGSGGWVQVFLVFLPRVSRVFLRVLVFLVLLFWRFFKPWALLFGTFFWGGGFLSNSKFSRLFCNMFSSFILGVSMVFRFF